MSNGIECLSIFGFQLNSLNGSHKWSGSSIAGANGLAMGDPRLATGTAINDGMNPRNGGMTANNAGKGRIGTDGNEQYQARNSSFGVNITNLNIRENDPCPKGTRHSLGGPRKRSEAEGGAPRV